MIHPFRGYITNQFAPFLALRLRQIHRAGDAVDGLTSLGCPGPSCVNEYYVSLKIHVTLQKTNMKLSSKKWKYWIKTKGTSNQQNLWLLDIRKLLYLASSAFYVYQQTCFWATKMRTWPSWYALMRQAATATLESSAACHSMSCKVPRESGWSILVYTRLW